MKFTVNTGFGYIKDSNGKIIAKYELPKGEHPAKEGYTYVEVASKADLDNITIDIEEKPLTQEQQNELKIKQEMRAMAIERLKQEGKLPEDYK